jgi:hypothetical protein
MQGTEPERELQVDTDAETLTQKNIEILFDLHEDIVHGYRLMNASQFRGDSQEALMHFTSALTTELIFLEQPLRKTKYWNDVHLGDVPHEQGTVEFYGLSSIVDKAEGIEVVVSEEAPGDTSAMIEKQYHIPIPEDILKEAFRALQAWFDDVGLATEFREGEDKWEI